MLLEDKERVGVVQQHVRVDDDCLTPVSRSSEAMRARGSCVAVGRAGVPEDVLIGGRAASRPSHAHSLGTCRARASRGPVLIVRRSLHSPNHQLPRNHRNGFPRTRARMDPSLGLARLRSTPGSTRRSPPRPPRPLQIPEYRPAGLLDLGKAMWIDDLSVVTNSPRSRALAERATSASTSRPSPVRGRTMTMKSVPEAIRLWNAACAGASSASTGSARSRKRNARSCSASSGSGAL